MLLDNDNLPQKNTPLLNVLQTLSQRSNAAFYAPGHKGGRGISPKLQDLCGKLVFRADLPELPELDHLFAPEGVIEDAQALAAEIFGASKTWFLVNGSTCGIIASILATCGEGDKIILPRNIHQSAIAGLILSGATPIFLNPEYDASVDLTYSITPEATQIALQEHPEAKAVMMLYPTYQGVCGDLEAIAKITHQYNIPLLVDEAHGAHFAFHPDLPATALSQGADLTVQSTHKVLGAMTQASMLHLQGDRIDRERIDRALQLLESTSPSYLLLASLDAARQQMAWQGKELMATTLRLAQEASDKIAQINNLSVLEQPKQPTPGFINLDRTRLTVNLTQLNLDGFEVDRILNEQLGVTAELPTLQHLTFIISIGNTTEDIDRLVKAFITLVQTNQTPSISKEKQTFSMTPFFSSSDADRVSPRQAFFAPTQQLPIEQTVDRLCAELICPYPPGIPVLMPGEIISTEAIEYLQQILASGGSITGCSDFTLKTLKVLQL